MEKNKNGPQKFSSANEALDVINRYMKDSYEREVYRITQKRKKLLSGTSKTFSEDFDLKF